MFSTAVLSARKADEHYLKIQGEHRQMVDSMMMQSMKVQALTQQKDAETQQQSQQEGVMKADADKSENDSNNAALKMALDFQTKQQEIDIKRQALNSV